MIRALFADTRGGISMLSAFLIVALIGCSALAVEYGRGLLSLSEDQRAADLAAYSAAAVYNAQGNSTTDMTAAANNVAALNGLSGAATASLVTSPSGDGNSAVKVVVRTTDPLDLARVLGNHTSLPVAAVSYAEIAPGSAPGCFVALNTSGTGVTLTGGTAINADNCAVTSNASVSVHCGDTITTQNLNYSSTLSDSCSGIKPPAGKTLSKKLISPIADPVCGGGATCSDASVVTARSRLSTVTALSDPAAPSVPSGTNVFFDFNGRRSTTIASVAADGCAASFSSPVWTVTCSGSGPFNFGGISLQGGISVNFNTGGSSGATYNFNGMIDFSSGAALSFGPGTFNVSQGIITGGGSTLSFGAGTFNLGTLPSGKCSVNGESICHTGTLATFGGPSTFKLSGGIYVPGGYKLVLGSGSSNSFAVGADANGDSLNAGGGGNVSFADATGSGDVFQMAGNFDNGGGGSCLTVSAAVNHDINGHMNITGGVTLGSGVYTVDDYVAIGASGGGNVTCGGVSIGVIANDVTFVIGGNATVTCSDGSNQIFCIGAGYSTVSITAPTSATDPLDAYQGFAVIAPASGGAGADFSNGATSTKISGAFYIPTGPVILSGAATVGDTSSGDCLQMIASQISLVGGTATGSSCVMAGVPGSGGGTTSATISLVQ